MSIAFCWDRGVEHVSEKIKKNTIASKKSSSPGRFDYLFS